MFLLVFICFLHFTFCYAEEPVVVFPNSSLCFDGVQPGDGWNPQSLDWAEWSDWSRCQIFQEGIYKSVAICLGLLCSMLIVSSAATIFSLSVSLLFNSYWRMVLGKLQSDTQREGSGSGRIWEECFEMEKKNRAKDKDGWRIQLCIK